MDNNLFNNTEYSIDNKLNHIIDLIVNGMKENKENMLIVFNENISFKYLQYYNKPIESILNNEYNEHDIIELSIINNNLSFYKLIETELRILDIKDIDKHFFDCIYI